MLIVLLSSSVNILFCIIHIFQGCFPGKICGHVMILRFVHLEKFVVDLSSWLTIVLLASNKSLNLIHQPQKTMLTAWDRLGLCKVKVFWHCMHKKVLLSDMLIYYVILEFYEILWISIDIGINCKYTLITQWELFFFAKGGILKQIHLTIYHQHYVITNKPDHNYLFTLQNEFVSQCYISRQVSGIMFQPCALMKHGIANSFLTF